MTRILKKDLIKERERWRKNPDYCCFWSSPDNPLGLKLTPAIEPGIVHLAMTISKYHSGFPGIAHGGIGFTVLDGMMSWYLMSHLGRAGFTRTAKVEYNAPLIVGQTYRFEVTRGLGDVGSRSVKLHGTIFRLDDLFGKPCLSLECDFIIPNRKTAESILGAKAISFAPELFGDFA